MQLTHRDVKKILEIVDGAARVSEIEFVHNGLHFRCSRDPASTRQQTTISARPPTRPQVSDRDKKTGRTRDNRETVICAPLVGTFRRSPASAQSVSVEAGARVQAGQTIAAIKTANRITPIQTPDHGIVKHIFADDGEFVEFDQPLFVIRVT